ncbi:MAG: transcription termination/antitermination protein NusG [Candidatus Porifericomitaceae bacterium WSBS_2022_MAG_OTU9]
MIATAMVGDDVSSTTKKWYVVQAYSGFEQQVSKMLTERISLHGVQKRFGRILVPTEQIVEMRAGQKRRSSRKFFPGYVLVEMEMDDGLWHLVRSTPKVLGFIGGSNNRPTPISASDVEDILQRMEEGEGKPKPKFVYEPGEVVRVTDGVFKDFNGVLEEVDYEKNRLKVSVLIFGRSTPVELSFDQVEKE